MSLSEEINAIKNDPTLSYEEKVKRLSTLVTRQELDALLPKPKVSIRLKEPLSQYKGNYKVLHLSIHDIYFKDIIEGRKKEEYRDCSPYYMDKLTYEEDGQRYLVPYQAICFHVGRWKGAKSATIALKDIHYDGDFFIFHLGDLIK